MSQTDEHPRGVTECARHGTETRLRCSQCGTPICPKCSIATPVGQKCPDCARQPRSARAVGKPRQYAKAAGVGLLAAAAGGFVLSLLFTSVGFFTWIGSGVAGYLIARAVLWGSEGNRAAPFQWGAIVLSALAVEAAWLFGFGVWFPGGLNLITYLAAAYGAWLKFNR
ncbi:MAG: B-box zinc finger protein [Nitriliruptorales bacterium]|nr:B-box zinc finger protein [Nitriliruptorales bacterium]